MQYETFVKDVQTLANLPSSGDAVKAIRATLQTLGARILDDERNDLAAQLPQEIAYYLREVPNFERFSLPEFYERISAMEDVDIPAAKYHAQAVIAVLVSAVSSGEIADVLAELPVEFRVMFEESVEQALAFVR